MLRTVKYFFLLAICGLCLYGLQRFCHAKTDGFAVCKLRKAFPDSSLFPPPIEYSLEKQEAVKEILKSPLKYLGRGGQCYAFVTEDEKYVVKILKYNNNYPRFWFRWIPFPFGLEKYRQQKLSAKQKKIDGEYKSYQIAWNHLEEETGILYFHLHSGLLENVNLKIADKLRIPHTLAADSLQFYIQKKGTPFYAEFARFVEQGKLDEAKNAIDEFVSYLFTRAEKQILDKDRGIWRNFAFYENHPFQIDIGQFIYDASLLEAKKRRENLLFFVEDFHSWLQKIEPKLASYLVESILSYSTDSQTFTP